jgi:hemerythrin superfamily protein
MNATRLLKKDHNAVKRLFAEFRRLPARAHRKRQELVERIAGEIERHTRIEEELFYPAVGELAAARDIVAEAHDDHEAVRTLLADVLALDPMDAALSAHVDELRELVLAHASEEELEMFPFAARLGDDRLERIGSAMEARKQELGERVLAAARRHEAA